MAIRYPCPECGKDGMYEGDQHMHAGKVFELATCDNAACSRYGSTFSYLPPKCEWDLYLEELAKVEKH